MILRTSPLRLVLAAALLTALTSASAAHAAYLSVGTSNTGNATTTLTGNTAGPELAVQNANGSAASAFGLYGLLSATSPTAASAAVRGHNSSTNAYGYGVWGSQAGSGIGVYGYAPSGSGVSGATLSGRGVLGFSSSGNGVRGQSTTGTALFGLDTAASPTTDEAAVRGDNGATNSHGYGVYGSQSGSGTGVYGYTPSGRSVWGSTSSGIGVRGSSSSGTGVFASSSSGIGLIGQHLAGTGTVPGVSASTNSTAADADALVGTVTPTSPGLNSEAVRGVNNGTGANGIGVFGAQNGSGYGVYGSSPSGKAVFGTSTSGSGVYGQSSSAEGVIGESSSASGVFGSSPTGRGVAGFSGSWQGVYGHSNSQAGVVGESGSFDGVWGQAHTNTTAGVSGHNNVNTGGYGVWGGAAGGTGVYATGFFGLEGVGTDIGVYGKNTSGGDAGYFAGKVEITGGCTGCAGPSLLQIDDPLDPAHKYLQHSSVASSQQLDIYSDNVTTNGKGFATVHMPSWFQALNRSFRYQLTSLSGLQQVAVAKEMQDNRFTIQSQRPHAKVSWQVSAVRHDRYANANPTEVIVPKPKADQGKYLQPELYGKPKRDAIGYQKAPRVPHTHSTTKGKP